MSSHGHHASELVICKSVVGGLEESRREVVRWRWVGSLSAHLEWSAMLPNSVEVFKIKGYVQR